MTDKDLLENQLAELRREHRELDTTIKELKREKIRIKDEIVRLTDMTIMISARCEDVYVPLSTRPYDAHYTDYFPSRLIGQPHGSDAEYQPTIYRPMRMFFDGLRQLDGGEVLQEGDVYATKDPWSWWATILFNNDALGMDCAYEKFMEEPIQHQKYFRALAKTFRATLCRFGYEDKAPLNEKHVAIIYEGK